MNPLDRRITTTLHALDLTGGPVVVRTLLRDILKERTNRHPLQPTGDHARDRLVAARLNLREGQHA